MKRFFLMPVMAVLAACSGPIISENEINNGPIQGTFQFSPSAETDVTAADAVIAVCNEEGYAFPSQPSCVDTDFDATTSGLAFETDRRGTLETGTVSVIETGSVLLQVRRIQPNKSMGGELFYTDLAGKDYKLTPLKGEPHTYRLIFCEGAGCPLGWRDGGDGGDDDIDAETYLVAITADTDVPVNVVVKTVDPETQKSNLEFGAAGKVLEGEVSVEFEMAVGHILAISLYGESMQNNLIENCRTSSEAVLWLTVEGKDPVALNKCTENFLTGELKAGGVFITTGDTLVRIDDGDDGDDDGDGGDDGDDDDTPTPPTGDPVLSSTQMPVYFTSGSTVRDVYAFDGNGVHDSRWSTWQKAEHSTNYAYQIGQPFVFNCVLTSGRWGVELADRTQNRATCVTTVHAPWCTNRTSFQLEWYDTNGDGISDLWMSNGQQGGNFFPQIEGTRTSEGTVNNCRLTNSAGLVLAQ